MPPPPLIHLVPSPIPYSGVPKWSSTGRTLSFASSPSSAELAVFVTPKPSGGVELNKVDGAFQQDGALYLGKWGDVEEGLNHLYTESSEIFLGLQTIYKTTISSALPQLASTSANPLGLSQLAGSSVFTTQEKGLRPTEVQVGYYKKIVEQYEHRLEQLRFNPAYSDTLRSHAAILSSILSLATLLFLSPDEGRGVVGEELLHWVNQVEQPEELLQEKVEEVVSCLRCWEEGEFWTMLMKSIVRGFFPQTDLLLSQLHEHPQPSLATFSRTLTDHLKTFPRSTSTSFSQEHQYLSSLSRFRSTLRAKVDAFARGKRDGEWFTEDMERGRKDEMKEYEEYLRRVVEMLCGDEQAVREECADWREMLGAWGLLVNGALKRDDLPKLMLKIEQEFAPDTTLPEEAIQVALISGDVSKALVNCHELDLWLAAHLGDVLDHMGLIEDDAETFEIALRDYFILEYTDLLLSKDAYWQIACGYLYTCGAEGVGRMRSLIVRVGLDPDRGSEGSEEDADGEMDIDGLPNGQSSLSKPTELGEAGLKQKKVEKVEALLRACEEYEFESESREICRAFAEKSLRDGQYGIAVEYGAKSCDGPLMCGMADKILDIYVTEGQAPFRAALSTIPSFYLSPRTTFSNFPNSAAAPSVSYFSSTTYSPTPFVPLGRFVQTRFTFLGRFQDFLEAMEEGDTARAAGLLSSMFAAGIVPRNWWAILLMDSVSLLQDEEILFTAPNTFELMRYMEDISLACLSTPLSMPDYLLPLYRTTISKPALIGKRKTKAQQDEEEREGMKEVLKGLDAFRLAAVKNLGRVGVDLVAGWR